jgi:hypothetical protein
MKAKCKWKHLGGMVVASCSGHLAITGYEYDYKESPNFHKTFFYTIMYRFKYCPLCGNPIELPEWLVEQTKDKRTY